MFAYATPESILLRTEQKVSSSSSTPNAPGATADVAFNYPITGSFGGAEEAGGLGAPGEPISFDFNDVFMAAIIRTPAYYSLPQFGGGDSRAHFSIPTTPFSSPPLIIRVWSLANGEVLPKKTPLSLLQKFGSSLAPPQSTAAAAGEHPFSSSSPAGTAGGAGVGYPYSICVAGKYHLLIGTTANAIVSLNTSHEGNAPNTVMVLSPSTSTSTSANSSSPTSSSTSTGGTVLTIAASKVRSDLIACGTSDGTLGIFLLHATTGLRQTHSLVPFDASTPPPSSVSSPSASSTTLLLPTSIAASGSAGGRTGGVGLPITALAFSLSSDNYLAVAGGGVRSSSGRTSGGGGTSTQANPPMVVLCSVDAGAVIMTFSYPARDVSGLAWSAWEQGALYVTSAYSDVVRKYVVNTKHEVESIAAGTQSYVSSILSASTTIMLSPSCGKRLVGADHHPHHHYYDGNAGDGGAGEENEEGEVPTGIRGISCLDSKCLALGLVDGSIHVYDVARQQTSLHTSSQHTRPVRCAAIQKQDPQIFITGGADGVLQIWSAAQPLRPLQVLHLRLDREKVEGMCEKRRKTMMRMMKRRRRRLGGGGDSPLSISYLSSFAGDEEMEMEAEAVSPFPPALSLCAGRNHVDPGGWGGRGIPASASAPAAMKRRTPPTVQVTALSWSINAKQLRLYAGLHNGEVLEVNCTSSTLMWRRSILAGTEVQHVRYIPSETSSTSTNNSNPSDLGRGNRASSLSLSMGSVSNPPASSSSSYRVPAVSLPLSGGGGNTTNVSNSNNSSVSSASQPAVLLVAGGGGRGGGVGPNYQLEDDEDEDADGEDEDADGEGVVVMLSKDGGTVLRTWSLPSGAAITAMEVETSQSKMIILGGADQLIYFYPLIREPSTAATPTGNSGVGARAEFSPLRILSGHLAPISALAWNMVVPNMFASASEDGMVCVWNLQANDLSSSQNILPIHVFHHHSPSSSSTLGAPGTEGSSTSGGGGSIVDRNLTPGEVASSLYLSSSSMSTNLPTTSTRVRTTLSSAVRALAWCDSLMPHLLMSGGDDAVICLWNAHPTTMGKKIKKKSGKGKNNCLCRVRNGHAPLSALLTHPDKPRRLTSIAGDGTITHWGITPLAQLALDATMGILEQRLERSLEMMTNASPGLSLTSASPSSLFSLLPVASKLLVQSPPVQTLLQELRSASNNDTSTTGTLSDTPNSSASQALKKLEKIIQYFDDGTFGWKDLVYYCVQMMNPSSSVSSSVGETVKQSLVFPTTQLVEAYRSHAYLLTEKARGKAVAAKGLAYKKSRLLDAADRLWKSGLLTEAIQVWEEAGEWDLALAVAPALGNVFWSNLCGRAAAAMEKLGRLDRAATYWIAAGESSKAASVYARAVHPQGEAALVVNLSCPQATTSPPSPSSSAVPGGGKGGGGEEGRTIDVQGTTPVSQFLRQDRTRLLHALRSPLIDATLLLENKKNDEAIALLANSGTNVPLSYLLLYTIPVKDQKSVDVVYAANLQHCCGHGQWEAALGCASLMPHKQDAYAMILAAFQDRCQTFLQEEQQQQKEEEQQHGGSGGGGGGNNNDSMCLVSVSQPPSAIPIPPPIIASGVGGGGPTTHTNHPPTSSSSTSALISLLGQLGSRIQQECNRLQASLDLTVVQQQHANDGLASQFQLAVMAIQGAVAAASAAASQSSALPPASSSASLFSSSPTLLPSFNGFLESLLGVILQDVDGPHAGFFLRQAFSISRYIALPHRRPVVGGGQNTNGIPDVWSTEHRQFLSLSLLVSTLMCVKLFRLPSLLNFAFTKASELAIGISTVESLISRLHPCLGSYSPKSTEAPSCIPSGGEVLLFDPTPASMKRAGTQAASANTTNTNNSGGGSRDGGGEGGSACGSGRLTSFISGGCITGPVVPLVWYPPPSSSASEGSPKTVYIGKEEAIQWSMISPFSPVLDGSRFYPVA